ncbi:TRAP transporter small permease [Bacillus sp. SG-1]|uniref:TRAP transporter small permease n=1 Tax=Bacillus sp. SG-1 TaxID=161544 RepID=UPI0002F66A62|nr:TRAP transporter small permease [Bacillus sp. SG-1]
MKILDRFINVIDVFASILMVLLTMVVFGEVLSRYVFNFPLVFSTELTNLLFPWIIFITAISVTKNEDHLSINFLRDKMSRNGRKITFILTKLVMMFFSFYMVLSSYQIAKSVVNQPLPMLRISKAWLYSSVTVSFTLIFIILTYQLIMIIMNKMEAPREEDMYDLVDDR